MFILFITDSYKNKSESINDSVFYDDKYLESLKTKEINTEIKNKLLIDSMYKAADDEEFIQASKIKKEIKKYKKK